MWLFVHYDKEGVPDCIADSSKELAEKLGMNICSVRTMLAKERYKHRFAKIYVDEEEE